jgi:membrane protein
MTRARRMPLMRIGERRFAYVARHPMAFCSQVLHSFRDNQVFLLAGALAYYLLLSIVPLLILMWMALSRLVDRQALLKTLGEYLERIVPGQSAAILDELYRFSSNSSHISWMLVGTLIFFSSQGFSVLEKSMSIIFLHRIELRRRHIALSAVIPYCYVVVLVLGLLLMTLISQVLQSIGAEHLETFGLVWSLKGVSGQLVYLLGVVAEVILLTSLYLIVPAGSRTWRHALVGASAATIAWELIRHPLMWYFQTRSKVGLVYGSLTSAIVILTSFEVFSLLLLLGAQVIAEYERIGSDSNVAPSAPPQIPATPHQ